MFKTEFRNITTYDNWGQEHPRLLRYTLYFDSRGKLEEIRNAFNHCVERNSDCWDFFTQKYNQNGKPI